LYQLERPRSLEAPRLVSLRLVNQLLGLMILLGSFYTSTALADSPVSLYKSYAGNLSFVLAGASFRDSETNTCSTTTTATGSVNNLPIDAEVVAAYLYWIGSYDASSGDTPDDTVIFAGSTKFDPSMETHSLSANGTTYDFYSGKSDVTSIVQTRRNGSYEMSGLQFETGNPHCSASAVVGGWSMVVIYKDDSEPTRVVNLYDGFQPFRGSRLDIIANNFEISGTPSGKHAHITWEGDVGNSGPLNNFNEALILTTSSGTRELVDSINTSGAQFNSRSNIYPSSPETYGLDIDEYNIGQYLTPGETSFTTRYSSGSDFVLLSAEITSVSNISVADLAVTTSDPTGWQQGSTVTKKYTISNNGPDNIPTNSVRFTTTLPTGVSFIGTQGDSDWVCTPNPNTGQTISCIYQNKLRSGWSDYLDLQFKINDGIAGNDLTINALVEHDLAPYDIFDNQATNDNYQFTVPITTDATTDLSASSKTHSSLSGDVLLAGDTLQFVITIKDAAGLAANNIQVTDNLPANITGYSITSLPAGATNDSLVSGGTNGTGFIDIKGISLSTSIEEQIIIEVYLDPNTPEGASLQNTATITWDDPSSATDPSWLVDTGDITVVKPDLSASTKVALDMNGDWLLPDETVRYTITLDDTKELDLTGLQVTDNLPTNISSFSVISIPAGASNFSMPNGGSNGTGFIDIRNIALAPNTAAQIIIDAVVDSNAPDKADLKNTAAISLNSATWSVESNSLPINISVSTPASGNKPLYLSNSVLTRNLPSTNSDRDFRHGETLTWPIDTNLQSDLELSSGDIRFNLAIEGYRTGGVETKFIVTLYFSDNTGGANTTIASGEIPFGNYRIDTFYDKFTDMNLASNIVIPQGSTIFVSVLNESSNSNNNQYSQIDVQAFNGNFYSAAVLNANTVINVDNITIWDQTYGDPAGSGDGNLVANSQPDRSLFIRAQISDPFGAFDISAVQILITKADATSYDFSAHPDGKQDFMTQVDTNIDDLTTASKIYEKEITLLEENESIGWWQISITGFEGLEVAPNQVTHERINTFKIIPFLPNVSLSKVVKVINDPINLTVNPRAIPQAEVTYTIKAVNSGRGKSDLDSIFIEDEIPENSQLFINNLDCNNLDTELTLVNDNNGPVCFLTGASPNESGLVLFFDPADPANDNIWFAKADRNFNYQPSSITEYDPDVRFIRMQLNGELNNQGKGSTDEPKFGLTYKVRID
jgi:uncharacterized repeat protein (TIGR01451 family)